MLHRGKIWELNDKDFVKLVKLCNTQSDIIAKIGLRAAGGNFDTLRKRLKKNELV